MNLLTVMKGKNRKQVNEIIAIPLQKRKGNRCKNIHKK